MEMQAAVFREVHAPPTIEAVAIDKRRVARTVLRFD